MTRIISLEHEKCLEQDFFMVDQAYSIYWFDTRADRHRSMLGISNKKNMDLTIPFAIIIGNDVKHTRCVMTTSNESKLDIYSLFFCFYLSCFHFKTVMWAYFVRAIKADSVY